jgi:hypothetical protein
MFVLCPGNCQEYPVKRLTQNMMFVSFNSKHELLTSTEHMSSPSDFSGVYVARSLVLCVMFY